MKVGRKMHEEAAARVRENARLLVRSASPVAILKVAATCDGHTIFDGVGLAKDCGLHIGIMAALERTHKSGSHPKERIAVPGKPGAVYEQLRGVYGLDLLMFIAEALELKYPTHFHGRGFLAQAIQSVIYKHLGFESGELPPQKPAPRCPKHPRATHSLKFEDRDWSKCHECKREFKRKRKSPTPLAMAVRQLQTRLREAKR